MCLMKKYNEQATQVLNPLWEAFEKEGISVKRKKNGIINYRGFITAEHCVYSYNLSENDSWAQKMLKLKSKDIKINYYGICKGLLIYATGRDTGPEVKAGLDVLIAMAAKYMNR